MFFYFIDWAYFPGELFREIKKSSARKKLKIMLKIILKKKLNKLDSTIVVVTEFRSTMQSLNGGLQYEKGLN